MSWSPNWRCGLWIQDFVVCNCRGLDHYLWLYQDGCRPVCFFCWWYILWLRSVVLWTSTAMMSGTLMHLQLDPKCDPSLTTTLNMILKQLLARPLAHGMLHFFLAFFDILMVDMAFQVDWVCRSAKKLWWIFFHLPAVCLFWLLLCEVLRSWILRDAIMCNSFVRCCQVGSIHRCPLW